MHILYIQRCKRFVVCAGRLLLRRVHILLVLTKHTHRRHGDISKDPYRRFVVRARRIRGAWRKTYVGMVGATLTLFALEGVVPGDELLLFAVFGETAAAPVPDAPQRPPILGAG